MDLAEFAPSARSFFLAQPQVDGWTGAQLARAEDLETRALFSRPCEVRSAIKIRARRNLSVSSDPFCFKRRLES